MSVMIWRHKSGQYKSDGGHAVHEVDVFIKKQIDLAEDVRRYRTGLGQEATIRALDYPLETGRSPAAKAARLTTRILKRQLPVSERIWVPPAAAPPKLARMAKRRELIDVLIDALVWMRRKWAL